MKQNGEILVSLVVLILATGSGYAQCLPEIPSLPPQQIRGDILCEDTSIPTNIRLVWLKVDGATCPELNFTFVYPFTRDGYYQLIFWIDSFAAHDISFCVEAQCGTDTVQAGFSSDGKTAYPCDNVIVFEAYRSIIGASVIFHSKTLGLRHEILVLLIFLLTILIPLKLR